ncbi:hypothetical protein PHMEG_00041585 [Phytophthora megakarya]|uniref:CCHC-type domain-containing protein n=1 Tax=Phytophthora megakarya TaxID=4795 RepID=A0A225UBL3_9STRA|nr:hypothetical protein PHMEG_00041585 [Phytophthora megakarya]
MSARNWYRQLSRSTFQTQYCGRGVSVARQYYHAKKRSDESPLEYLHRLNVAGLRAKLQVKDGPLATRREHVEHFTVGNTSNTSLRHLADQLALLRLTDAEDLEETLRARQRAKARQGKTHAGSNKFQQKAALKPPSASSKNARAVRAIRVAEDSSESESDVSASDQEDECRRVYLAEAKDRENHSITPTHRDGAADHPTMSQKNCTHCGSTKHDNLGCWKRCWKRLTCQKCGRKGHPSDHCLFVCRACGEMHEPGKCPMEEFYNLIR